jgi:membrane protease subunit (stomatin/prohibitin family)
MGHNNIFFLEEIEWFDETGLELVHRIPEGGSGEIKWGAQLTVRENQAAVFFYQGKAIEVFGGGRHTLKTANIPLLTKMASIPWGMTSPLRAEVYFVNMKTFSNLKWGTRDPVAFKDSELGLIRLRAFGVFNLRVTQPLLFINRMVGTQGLVTTEAVEDYLNQVIVSRLNDFLGEQVDSILTLPGQYQEFSDHLVQRLQQDFNHFGLGLTHLYINAITPPSEVQKAIDDKSRMTVFQDMNKLMQMKTAMAVEKIADGGDSVAGQGMGAGMGLMLPAMFARYFTGASSDATKPSSAKEEYVCTECKGSLPEGSKFCPHCGHQQLVFTQCLNCGKNLTPNARFCSRCGHPTEEKPRGWVCDQCGWENLAQAIFCNQCGEKH